MYYIHLYIQIHKFSECWKVLLCRAFCNPADVEAFTEEKKETLLTKRHGKGADFIRAVQEIIECYEKSKKENQVNSNDEVTDTIAGNSVDPPMTNLGHNKGALAGGPDDAVPTASSTKFRASSRRSRISSQGDSSRFQNFILPANGSLRRNKRTRKSPDGSARADSPALLSTISVEDNGSEIATADSDTLGFNEGSTMESGCIIECSERVGDYRLDLQTKATVIKKKRKPNRKRLAKEVVEQMVRLNKEADLEIEIHESRLHAPNACEKSNEKYPKEVEIDETRVNAPNACEKSDEKCSKEDGDEHLPLVKRARVRMGESMSSEKELDNLLKSEEISLKENVSCDDDRMSDAIPDDSPPTDNNCSLTKECRPQLGEVKKTHLFGSEAALPPSKRLHRALEAMSANVAEDSLSCVEAPTATKPSSNGCSVSAEDGSGNTLPKPQVCQESQVSFVNVKKVCDQPSDGSSSPKHRSCKDTLNDRDLSEGSPSGAHVSETVYLVNSSEPLSPAANMGQSSFNSEQSPSNQFIPSEKGVNIENIKLRNRRADESDKEVFGLEDYVLGGASKVSPENTVNLPPNEDSQFTNM